MHYLSLEYIYNLQPNSMKELTDSAHLTNCKQIGVTRDLVYLYKVANSQDTYYPIWIPFTCLFK